LTAYPIVQAFRENRFPSTEVTRFQQYTEAHGIVSRGKPRYSYIQRHNLYHVKSNAAACYIPRRLQVDNGNGKA
jgi:hypothetical protein